MERRILPIKYMLLLKLALLGITTSAPVTTCANTNRLCIENANVREGEPFNLYFASNLFPIDVDTSALVLNVYLADSVRSLNFDPCKVPGTLVSSNSPLSLEATDSTSVSSTRAVIKFNNAPLTAGTKFILQLTDKDSRQCLLGPNIGQVYTESIEIDRKSNPDSSNPNTEPTIKPNDGDPDTELPIEGGSATNTTTILVVAAFVVAVALVIAATVLLCRRKFRKGKKPPKFGPPRDENGTLDRPRQSMDVRRSGLPQNLTIGQELPSIEEGGLGIESEHPEWNNDDTMTRRVDKWASGLQETSSKS